MGVIMGNRLVGMVSMVVGMGMAVGHVAVAVFVGMNDDLALPAAFAAIVRLDLSGAAAFRAFLGCIGHDRFSFRLDWFSVSFPVSIMSTIGLFSFRVNK
jgi:hydroxyethylthiazole kinase-like sugar kinase family protein